MIKIHEEGEKYEGKPMKIMFTKEEAEKLSSGYMRPYEFKGLILKSQKGRITVNFRASNKGRGREQR